MRLLLWESDTKHVSEVMKLVAAPSWWSGEWRMTDLAFEESDYSISRRLVNAWLARESLNWPDWGKAIFFRVDVKTALMLRAALLSSLVSSVAPFCEWIQEAERRLSTALGVTDAGRLNVIEMIALLDDVGDRAAVFLSKEHASPLTPR